MSEYGFAGRTIFYGCDVFFEGLRRGSPFTRSQIACTRYVEAVGRCHVPAYSGNGRTIANARQCIGGQRIGGSQTGKNAGFRLGRAGGQFKFARIGAVALPDPIAIEISPKCTRGGSRHQSRPRIRIGVR